MDAHEVESRILCYLFFFGVVLITHSEVVFQMSFYAVCTETSCQHFYSLFL